MCANRHSVGASFPTLNPGKQNGAHPWKSRVSLRRNDHPDFASKIQPTNTSQKSSENQPHVPCRHLFSMPHSTSDSAPQNSTRTRAALSPPLPSLILPKSCFRPESLCALCPLRLKNCSHAPLRHCAPILLRRFATRLPSRLSTRCTQTHRTERVLPIFGDSRISACRSFDRPLLLA